MYEQHFGLRELPFGLTPDTGFACPTPDHRRALNTLLLALANGEGFVTLSGEVGTGKTLLARCLLGALPPGTTTAYVPNPSVSPHDMLSLVADELEARLSRARPNRRELHASLQARLLELAAAERPVVLVVDEAQALSLETLETLRLLSNLESGKRKLLQTVLVGQPELDQLLASRALRSLASRIGFAARLGRLGFSELRSYLQHRLVVAGWSGEPLFSTGALALLWHGSRGVPRSANVLANKCLLLAYGEGAHHIGWRHAWFALRDRPLRGGNWIAALTKAMA